MFSWFSWYPFSFLDNALFDQSTGTACIVAILLTGMTVFLTIPPGFILFVVVIRGRVTLPTSFVTLDVSPILIVKGYFRYSISNHSPLRIWTAFRGSRCTHNTITVLLQAAEGFLPHNSIFIFSCSVVVAQISYQFISCLCALFEKYMWDTFLQCHPWLSPDQPLAVQKIAFCALVVNSILVVSHVALWIQLRF